MKKTGPAAEVVDCDKLAEKADSNLNLVYFGAESGHAYDQFISAAKDVTQEKYQFFVSGADCAATYGAADGGMAIIRKFDEPHVAYSGEVHIKDILAWMNGNSVPVVFEFGEDFIEPIFGSRKPAVFLFTEEKDTAY